MQSGEVWSLARTSVWSEALSAEEILAISSECEDGSLRMPDILHWSLKHVAKRGDLLATRQIEVKDVCDKHEVSGSFSSSRIPITVLCSKRKCDTLTHQESSFC